MKTRKLKFLAHESKDKVSSLLHVPNKAKAIVVLGHGAGAGMTHTNMDRIAEVLSENAIGTFRYQFPFMERGGGRDSQTVSLSTVVNAVEKAHSRAPDLPLYAGGHSFGGRMTSLAAAETGLELAEGLIFFAFPLHAPNRPSSDRAGHLPDIKQPMLFLTGTRDALCSLELFEPIIKKLNRRRKGPKAKLHLLETANHSYKILKRTRESTEDVFDEMGRVASEWIDG